jgi:hypothetical protein
MHVWLIDHRGYIWDCKVLEETDETVLVRTIVSTEDIRLPCAALAAGIVEHSTRIPLGKGKRRWVPQTLRFTANPDVAADYEHGANPRDS